MRDSLLFLVTPSIETYPAICPDSPSYNPNISADDCADLSCCEFSGDLAAVGHKPIDFVKETNMVAFYDSSDPDGLYWAEAYANKTIEVSKTFNGRKYIFNATILDNCVNSDCDDCCIRDSTSTGYLLVRDAIKVKEEYHSYQFLDSFLATITTSLLLMSLQLLSFNFFNYNNIR